MTRYHFELPIRAIGQFRLPKDGLSLQELSIVPQTDPEYVVRIEGCGSEVRDALEQAVAAVDEFLMLVSLLGDDAAFIRDCPDRIRACNLTLRAAPISASEPPPLLESIGGLFLTEGGRKYFGDRIDPDGSLRRSGAISVSRTGPVKFVPNDTQFEEIGRFFDKRDQISNRIRVAVGLVHDAACARELASSFVQSFTALEVLAEERQPPTVLDLFFREISAEAPYGNKSGFLGALKTFLANAHFPEAQVERLTNHVAMTRSQSQVDVFHDYLARQNVTVTRKEIGSWRSLRGKLVHAAQSTDEDRAAMRRCRQVVREAILAELRS